jgi:hypothetical protein
VVLPVGGGIPLLQVPDGSGYYHSSALVYSCVGNGAAQIRVTVTNGAQGPDDSLHTFVEIVSGYEVTGGSVLASWADTLAPRPPGELADPTVASFTSTPLGSTCFTVRMNFSTTVPNVDPMEGSYLVESV